MNENTTPATNTDKKKKRLKKILYALAAIFLILLVALIYYLFTQRPITRIIPGTSPAAPRYVKSVNKKFPSLSGLAANRNGTRVYAVDSTDAKVWAISSAGTVLFSFGRTVDQNLPLDGFITPLFVAVGPNDEIYVTDRARAKISVYNAKGQFQKFFTPKDEKETQWSPLAIDIDTNGDVYITDAKKGENRVMVFDKTGKLKFTFGKSGRGKGQFAYPNGIAVTSDRIYVADSSNARVQAFDKKGKFLFLFKPGTGTELTHPVGIDVRNADEILVAESFGGEVQAYNGDGGELYKFGSIGILDGQFRYPTGLAIASNGRVFVADRGNARIQIWQY